MQTPAIDISQYQGDINAAEVPQPIVLMKVGGGDNGLYFDPDLTVNYTAANAAKKGLGLYWFAGGTDATQEADKFIAGVQPYAEGDVYILDWEIEHADPVGWVSTFVNRVHSVTNVWPMVYMDIDRANRFDWSNVFSNCGFWCAAPSYGWDATLPVKYTVVMQQGPTESVPGINGPVDSDMFFGTLEEFKAYGYHAPAPAAAPAPAPAASQPTNPTPVPVVDASAPPQAVPVVTAVAAPVAPAEAPAVPASVETPAKIPEITKPVVKAQSKNLLRVILGAIVAAAALVIGLLHK